MGAFNVFIMKAHGYSPPSNQHVVRDDVQVLRT